MTTADTTGRTERSAGAASFEGWPEQAFTFFAELEADNSKRFWQEHRTVYEDTVRAPMEAFAELVAEDYGPLHIFRPYRDVRFSRDKSPYKTHMGAVTEGQGGEVFYVQVSADGLLAASGYYQMARDQLERFYAAVDDVRSGPRLEEIVAALAGRYDIGGSELKTAPRGYPRDHPRVELLRHKGVTIHGQFPVAAWHSTPEAATRITAVWDDARPLNDWLTRHVGPSTLPPPEPR
jgi:uncharacterized protein (TIGR02453 family)